MAQSQATMMAPQPTMMAPHPTMMFMPSQMQARNRKRANTVAIVDIVLGILNLLCCILESIFAYLQNHSDKEKIKKASLTDSERQKEIHKADVKMYVNISIDVIEMCISGVWIWLAFELLKATKIATPPDQSLRKAKWWRGFHIFLLSIRVFLAVVTYLINSFLFYWHCICLLVLGLLTLYVHRFIQDLQRAGGAPMMMDGAPMMMDGGNSVPTDNTSTQYHQNSQDQQQPNNQNLSSSPDNQNEAS